MLPVLPSLLPALSTHQGTIVPRIVFPVLPLNNHPLPFRNGPPSPPSSPPICTPPSTLILKALVCDGAASDIIGVDIGGVTLHCARSGPLQ